MHRKPTGTTGYLELPARPDESAFKKLVFPASKDQIEAMILDRHLASLQASGIDLYELQEAPEQNAENHFDFTLTTTSGREYLDLMEVAPLEGLSRGYSAAPLRYNNGDMAESVWKKLRQKERHYGQPMTHSVHLLLYSTDQAFRLCHSVLEILAYSCDRVRHGFKTVSYYHPDSEESGEATVISPRNPASFAGFNLREHQQRMTMIANLSEPTVVGSGESVEVLLGRRTSKD